MPPLDPAANEPATSIEHIDDAGYRSVDPRATHDSARMWWDANAVAYTAEHGEFLGAADFRWCPEGLREADARLLGEVRGRDILEIGAGAAQCSRWLAGRGARVVATDISAGMLHQSRALDAATGTPVPVIQADARCLPVASESVDVAFTSFGALPFVAEAEQVHREVARVLRPGGSWTFAVTHPLRWAFPDDPSERGLTAHRSYFDRTPYIESFADGRIAYAEYHRTIGDHVRDVVTAGFTLLDIVEPEWPGENTNVWGGWGPVRGKYLPGTAIFRCVLP